MVLWNLGFPRHCSVHLLNGVNLPFFPSAWLAECTISSVVILNENVDYCVSKTTVVI